MSIKHVAIIVKYFPTVSETFIVNQINGLMDAGYKVSLYAYNKVDISIVHESLKKYNLLTNVQYFVKPPVSKISRLFIFFKWTARHLFKIKWFLFFKSLNVFKFGKDAYTLKLFFEAQWFLVPYDFELIHAHFGMNGNRIAYLKACGIISKQVKLITTFHGYDLVPNRLHIYKEEYKFLFKEATAFTVNTPYLDSILQQVNSFHKPIYVMPVGLDTSFFKKLAANKTKASFNLVFCGRLIAFKGPDLAIVILKKLHQLKYLNVRLHIIGNGKLYHQLKNQVRLNNLQEFVFFHGALSQIEIRKHFENADALLLSGRYDPETGRAETQGLVIQEAQAMELPVVVSDVGGMKYGMLPNKSGFVVAEKNLDGFVEAIKNLILDPELKFKMGRTGRLFVEHQYDNKVLIKILQNIYQDVTNMS